MDPHHANPSNNERGFTRNFLEKKNSMKLHKTESTLILLSAFLDKVRVG